MLENFISWALGIHSKVYIGLIGIGHPSARPLPIPEGTEIEEELYEKIKSVFIPWKDEIESRVLLYDEDEMEWQEFMEETFVDIPEELFLQTIQEVNKYNHEFKNKRHKTTGDI